MLLRPAVPDRHDLLLHAALPLRGDSAALLPGCRRTGWVHFWLRKEAT
jgi:hypothetical protein